jgi:hypothetical protein
LPSSIIPGNFIMNLDQNRFHPGFRSWISHEIHETHEKKSNRASSGVWLGFTRQVKAPEKSLTSGFGLKQADGVLGAQVRQEMNLTA